MLGHLVAKKKGGKIQRGLRDEGAKLQVPIAWPSSARFTFDLPPVCFEFSEPNAMVGKMTEK